MPRETLPIMFCLSRYEATESQIASDLKPVLILVVGAGPVGRRKATALAARGTRVRWVAPDGIDSPPAGVEVLAEAYRREHLDGVTLAFACTDEVAVNHQIAQDARCAGVLVNAVDQPADCDFFSAAVLREGPIQIAIGTGGAAPGLTGMLKERIADILQPQLGPFAECIEQLRDELRQNDTPLQCRMDLMRQLICEETYQAFCDAGSQAVAKRLTRLQEAGS